MGISISVEQWENIPMAYFLTRINFNPLLHYSMNLEQEMVVQL